MAGRERLDQGAALIMPRDRVQVHGKLTASADAVWAVARDFCGAWHPAMTSIRAETGPGGALVRAFTVTGEDTVYREQRTYFSDSDRVLGYTHLQGIAGAEAYDARISVTPTDGGCVVQWTATVSAPAARLGPICEGTRAVFSVGIEALGQAAAQAARPAAAPLPAPVPLTPMIFDDLPRLGVTVTPDTGGATLAIFLHGIGGARGNWDAQLAVAGRVMRCAALDLRGYGDSSLGSQQSTVDDYCADILRLRERLGADRLVLVGLSYGSWIATSFAMRHPELLAGLVLSGGCTGMSEAGPDEREAFRVSREVPMDAGQVPADFAPAVVKVLAGPDATDALRQTLFDSMAAIPAATYRDALVCFTNPLEKFDFARLTMPVLMMTGEYDRLAPPAEIRGVAGRIWDAAPRPDVRFEVVANAGHVCNVEQPAAYSRHLLDFLRRMPA
ncbi:MAG: alpha/beta fold hydrolase [Rhodobacteraceae bacterium]|nr:alpha/beta fold hydrolase [Paracoccaceae bacterium]